ncbi:MAG: hypothetical protein HON90_08555 [Halobacteriovoraceae bacterium]|jgi:hypothetical protein|nr:hypothetical protein [Halobacteriovoraceae bacterium]
MNNEVQKNIYLSLLTILIIGCNGITEVDQSSSSRSSASAYAGTNQALIYPDNPVALEGKNVSYANFEGYLLAKTITESNYLNTTCNFTQYSPDSFDPTQNIYYKDTTTNTCLEAFNDQKTATQILQSINGSWVYPNHSDEFYQVNTFYHSKIIMERYLESLSFAHKYVHLDSKMEIPPATKYNFIDTQSYWLTDSGAITPLKTYANCIDIKKSAAYFSPAQNLTCYGYDTTNAFKVVQDPSVIYHETGHAIVKAMMNQRNITSGIDPVTYNPVNKSHSYQSDLGEAFYDEAGAINEGIADYFSYYMNQRTKIAEFAFHKLIGSYRPIDEDEQAHTADVSTTGARLSYPEYLYYEPLDASLKIEDVHNAGAIVTHYLVALTKDLKSSCSYPTGTSNDEIHKTATNYVFLVLNETLAEIGDLTGKGSDLFSQYATYDSTQENVYFTNLNNEASFLWTQFVNPPNFRRFFRIFAKNTLHYISSGLCPEFSIDDSEQLLDDYGLLLFKSYEDRGNGIDSNSLAAQSYALHTGKSVFSSKTLIPFSFNTQVNEDNRKKSILISKDFMQLDTESVAIVIDSQTAVDNILSELTFEGKHVIPTEGIAGTEYNNGKINISPGEVVALTLNIFNNSNSTMGGIQILANDWDHMKLANTANTYINRTINKNALAAGDITGNIASHAPCAFDDFPSESEGGVTDTITTSPGNCSYISRTNESIDTTEVVTTTHSKYDVDSPQPICMVQYSDENETKWVSQDFFRTYSLGLEESDCLNNASMSHSNFNPNECLIRILPGANQSILGKIDPQKSWINSVKSENQVEFSVNAGNVVLMEVNKWISPGTKFNCRFRARFSNCRDCFDNFQFNDMPSTLTDYADYEYAGAIPYKIINFQFTVLD